MDKKEWKYFITYLPKYRVIVRDENGFICELTNREGCIENAHLIASAPDMFQALENLIYTATKLWDEVKPIKDTETLTVTHGIIEAAREALKKAKGEQ